MPRAPEECQGSRRVGDRGGGGGTAHGGPPDLPLGEVVLAEFLPQQPVLTEHVQVGGHLAEADQVAAVTQPLHDVQLEAQGQVGEGEAFEGGLWGEGGC